MADDITMEVARYRPDIESAPTTQSYKIPRRKDWSILDGLNYIKDRLDGTLSYRWSCRMVICGSCGMTVNGEPKLLAAHSSPTHGARTRRAVAQLPDRARPRHRPQ
jgi:fumarate reductase iron-sulfur subunit